LIVVVVDEGINTAVVVTVEATLDVAGAVTVTGTTITLVRL
jgi:hypothetical protein